jgi:hypothetical protein
VTEATSLAESVSGPAAGGGTDPAAASLQWAVRDSLLRYVLVIAHGTCATDGGVTMDESGVFGFGLRSATEVSDGEWRLSFAGSVRFTAHHGFLDILIEDPTVDIGPQGGVLSATTGGGRTAIARLGAAVPGRDGDRLVWPAIGSELLESAVETFGGVYPAGTEMAPLALHVPLTS